MAEKGIEAVKLSAKATAAMRAGPRSNAQAAPIWAAAGKTGRKSAP